ncbi:hypothetical protein K501DRAFT_327999 [Backusella circina FSU 941]|nr:hypothetical protein K501DRAFT_327999 [Backusella circina FSU 941]
MSDPSISHNVADINGPRQLFTQEEVDKIVAEVTKRVQETQLEESDRRREGSDLPSTHKYNNQAWVTAETTNPNFINQLKETKVDTAQLVNTIYRLTENTRVQAKAATELYEHLKYIMDRGLQQEDLQIFQDSIEQSRRLAVHGFRPSRFLFQGDRGRGQWNQRGPDNNNNTTSSPQNPPTATAGYNHQWHFTRWSPFSFSSCLETDNTFVLADFGDRDRLSTTVHQVSFSMEGQTDETIYRGPAGRRDGF